MSSSKSSSFWEGSPSSRYGDRTPLRSLENVNQHLSTPALRAKSKSLCNTDALKATNGDASLCDSEPPPHTPPSSNTTQSTATPCGDVTFKSFICAGGEVEISESSLCAEETIVLPMDQTVTNTCQTEDTVISDSMIIQSCSNHIEHPYYIPEMEDVSSVDISAAYLSVKPDVSQSSGDLDGECDTGDYKVVPNDCSGENNITWKSFVCDGGEVQVSDVTKLLDETIPLPKDEIRELAQDDSANSSKDFDSCQLGRAEHFEHPYCCSENGAATVATVSVTTHGSEIPRGGLGDVTYKHFNCTGGEIEFSDGIKIADETILLPTDRSESFSHGTDPSMLPCGLNVHPSSDHLDHPYSNMDENGPQTSTCNFLAAQESHSLGGPDDMVPNGNMSKQEVVSSGTFNSAEGEGEPSGDIQLPEKMPPLPKEQVQISQPLDNSSIPTFNTQDHIQETHEQPNIHMEDDEAVVDTRSPAVSASSLTDSSLRALDNEPVHLAVQETPEKLSIEPAESVSVLHKTESYCSNMASLKSPALVAEEQQPEQDPHVHPSSELCQTNEAKDSALGSSNGPIPPNSAEKLFVETLPDVLKVLSECPSVASALPFGILSPMVRRASQSVFKAHKDPAVAPFLADDSALEGEQSFLAPVTRDPTGLWTEHLDSPMSRPLFNSTALVHKPQPGPVTEPVEDLDKKPCAAPKSEVEKPVLENPLIPDGPLQQQLRQMAEFLMLASGKMGLAAFSSPVPPPVAPAVASVRAPPAEFHSVCVGTTPVKMLDHSLNTSGLPVADACTLTDPLLWNLPPGSLECLPRQELELRLTSSMVMVEALVQQLAVARTHGCPPPCLPPSDLREKVVQTDHTELSQTTMHRDLYLAALNRIAELEQDGSSLQNLVQCMQDMRVTMTCLSSDTDDAFANMRQMEDLVREDHQSLVSHYHEMKSLFEKSTGTQTRMMQRVKDALQQRNDMKTQMEVAFTAKEAAFSVMDQLRTHCATEISELQKGLGSQQELLAALNTTFPEQVKLNKACTEMLNSASDLLSQTSKDQSSLITELCLVRSLLCRTTPLLVKLNEKAAAALRERDEHVIARDQALEERGQMEEDLNQAKVTLQTASEEIGDLNLQVTILTSEMGVLRQKLTVKEEERSQLEMKVTEMSATVSSTLASHTFLEHALAAETEKLLLSQKDFSQVKDQADELESRLGQSEQRVRALSQALAGNEELLSQLQEFSRSQSVQIQQLQDVCAQLNGVREMNEFLQIENELAREQMAESESMLRANLQSLRERNIQCEDLKGELGQLHSENRSLQEQLDATRVRASATQQELEDKIAQAVTEITLLHHTLRGVTNELHAALKEEEPDLKKDTGSQPIHTTERRHPSSSFVDSVMVALTAEKQDEVQSETPAQPDMSKSHSEALFSETSAFTRIAAIAPKQNQTTQEFEVEDDQSSISDLLADLDGTVTELISSMKLTQQRKEAQLEELRNSVGGLEVEQQAATWKHEAQVLELKNQVESLKILAERGNQALQQKAQDEKMIKQLMAELIEAQELVSKHKTEYNDLRREAELRRSLQQSLVETEFMRAELKKAGGQSANFMEEKIQLLKEVERLKASLQEAQQARSKLLERAKKHQVIYQTNQQKSENELHMLNNMINKIREILLSLPEDVQNCEQIQQLVKYIG